MSNTEKEDRQYRRGVVLGLTMAELLLLFLFLLLLLAAVRIAEVNKVLVRISGERDGLVQQLTVAQSRIAELERMLGSAMIDVTKRYEAAKARAEELEQEVAKLRPTSALADTARKLWPDAQDTLAQAETALTLMKSAENRILAAKLAQSPAEAEATVVAAVDAAVRAAGTSSSADLARALSECSSAQKGLLDARGQVEALKKQCLAGGKGMVMPPCWPDGHGNPQYIFDARLTEGGIILHDNKVAGRERDQASLPLSGIRFEIVLGTAAFQAGTAPLLQWSIKNGCRHYVKVFDDTGPASKRLFQEQLRVVEGSFYKLPMYNSQ